MGSNNEKGVALLFVLTAITLLTIILADFSFETQINKLRTYNSQDQFQARLNAEAGLNLALLRLEIFQNARNLLEKNKNLKDNVRIQDLNQSWSIPFIYPIPTGNKIKLTAKMAIEKFMKNSFLEGQVSTEIKNISHLINLNLLRLGRPNIIKDKKEDDEAEEDEHLLLPNPNKIVLNLEQQLVDLFRQKFDRKLEEDDEFSKKYGSIDPEMLIKEIKFYVNDVDKVFEPEIDEIRAQYASAGIQAKHAPMESLSELYLLKGWDDELVDILKNEVTVHGVVVIDLNQITEQGLKLLIPEISTEQVKDFFEYRDDPKRPSFFNTLDGFKNYITRTAKILSTSEMDARIEQFLEAGIQFGVFGSLFQVISRGGYGRSEYTINAFVEIPIKPVAPSPEEDEDERDLEEREEDTQDGKGEKNPEQKDKELSSSKKKKKKKEPLQFLLPRIVEITVY